MIVSKYPPHICAAMQARAANLLWNVEVLVMAGTSQVLAQKKANALQDLQAGAIDLETYWEDTGRNPKVMRQRMDRQAAHQQRLQAQAAMAAVPAGGVAAPMGAQPTPAQGPPDAAQLRPQQ